MRLGEFQMINCALMAQHHTIEVIMTTEFEQDIKAQSIAIERQQGVQVICRTGNA